MQGRHNLALPLKALEEAASIMPSIQSRICRFPQKIRFLKNLTIHLKIFFQEIYDAEYAEKFEAAGIEYFYTLIDDAVAAVDEVGKAAIFVDM